MPFLIKMTLFASAIVLQVAIHNVPHMCEGTAWGKLATCPSFVCLFGVVYPGRAISFEILFRA